MLDSAHFFFFFNLGYSILPKNAPPLGTRAPESLSHIQTHFILNITIACCITHPAVHLHPQRAAKGGRHGTWPQCVSSCVKIATSSPAILMFDSHRWVLRRLSSSKGYDVQPWLLIHRKQQHWDARGMNLSSSRMPIKLNQPPCRWYTHEWHECVTTVKCH